MGIGIGIICLALAIGCITLALQLANVRRGLSDLKIEMEKGDAAMHERANMMNEDIGNLYAELEGVDSDLGRLITSSKLNSASIKAVDKRLRSLENVTNKMIAEKKEAEEKKSQNTTKTKTNTEEVHEVFAETSDDAPEGMTFAGTYELTAYTTTGNPTADGTMPSVGVTVACNDPSLWHRWIYIEGYGTYYCHDTGGMSVNVIDIFVGSYDEAIQFGRRSANVYLVN
jgi:3D (Asp-Asp-Asp) domain-containing protein